MEDNLPYNWNVVIEFNEDRKAFVAQIIKRKGYQVLYGGPWHSKMMGFMELSDAEVNALDNLGLLTPAFNITRVHSAGRFVSHIKKHSAPELTNLLEFTTTTARL